MNSIKDFKSIADEIMSGISAGEPLKAKTMGRIKKARARFYIPAISAACAAAAIIALVLAVFQPGPGSDLPGVMSATDSEPYAAVTAEKGISDAKAVLQGLFLEPGYAPPGFTLDSVSVSGEGEYARAELVFTDGKRAYLITEEKTPLSLTFEGYKSVDINGRQGYVKSNGGELPYTEVHWTEQGVHYAVTGSISEEDAIKVAISMK
jgi:hypothetical protein